MKIYIVVSSQPGAQTIDRGGGGHFYSAATIAKHLAEAISVEIVVIGGYIPHPFKELSIPVHFLNLSISDMFRVITRFRQIINKQQNVVLHSFDLTSHYFCVACAIGKNVLIAHTKCGGPTPTYWYPNCSNLIVFTQEDLEWFGKKNRSITPTLIPNRIERSVFRHEDISEKTRLDFLHANGPSTDDRSIQAVLISRFASSKLPFLLQTIALQKKCIEIDLPIKLTIIGESQCTKSLETVNESIAGSSNVRVITDPRVTKNASRWLKHFELVFATGRGVMEASSFGKIILCPSASRGFPVILKSENFEAYFRANFTARATTLPVEDSQTVFDLQRIFTCHEFRETLENNNRSYFDEFFSIETGTKKYSEFYSKLRINSGITITDLIKLTRIVLVRLLKE